MFSEPNKKTVKLVLKNNIASRSLRKMEGLKSISVEEWAETEASGSGHCLLHCQCGTVYDEAVGGEHRQIQADIGHTHEKAAEGERRAC